MLHLKLCAANHIAYTIVCCSKLCFVLLFYVTSFFVLFVISQNIVLKTFLHTPFCRAEGLCQQAAIKLQLLLLLLQPTPRGPIRVKQVN